MNNGIGLDVGTNMLVSAMMDADGNPTYKKQRDAFYRLTPKSEINAKSIRHALESKQANFIMEGGDFIVVGEDALIMANERNSSARRPMNRGVLSPKEKDSLPMMKLLIKSLLSDGVKGSNLVFSIPAPPVDGEFDIYFHTEMMNAFIRDIGYNPTAMNEGFAIAFSELLDDGLTGVCISCLVPGTFIYTRNGIKAIEDVKEADEVITHKGRYRSINKVITKNFSGNCTKIQLQGYADNTDMYKFVDNHELYVYRNNCWGWIGCEELVVGDIVGEPIVKRNYNISRPTITLCEHTTSSNNYIKTKLPVTADVQRLIGYFLGDGSIMERQSGIQFDFGKHETSNIEDVMDILDKNFHKNSSVIDKSDNCVRIKCYSTGIASWFIKNCYDENNIKCYPWDLERINRNDCLNLLTGLLRSDGNITDRKLTFYNTSTNLIILCKQLFSKLNIPASISFREPREHYYESEDRIIQGKKVEWCINSGRKEIFTSLINCINSLNCSNSKSIDKLFIIDGFCCSRVKSIEYEYYTGIVYDLQVEEDHSFSGPFLTIHNCGAGMTNVAVCYDGDPVLQFSLTRGGDWIDSSVAKAVDEEQSLVQLEKEGDIDLMNPVIKMHEALAVYYRVLIKYAIDNIVFELNKAKLPTFRQPLPIVISGGLTLANGFTNIFNDELKGKKFPFEVKTVRRANSPMTCVAHGCLIAAVL